MITKVFAIMFSAIFFIGSSNAATHNSLKDAYDDLNYSLTVEWDQKDQAFYDERTAEFSRSIEELKSAGLTNEEMLDLLKNEVKDEAFLKELDGIISTIEFNKMNQEEARTFLNKSMEKLYANGASWDSESGIKIGIIVFVAFVMVFTVSNGFQSSK